MADDELELEDVDYEDWELEEEGDLGVQHSRRRLPSWTQLRLQGISLCYPTFLDEEN